MSGAVRRRVVKSGSVKDRPLLSASDDESSPRMRPSVRFLLNHKTSDACFAKSNTSDLLYGHVVVIQCAKAPANSSGSEQ